MIIYRPTKDEVAVANVVGNIRNTHNGGQSNIPGGECADEHQRFLQHVAAVLGELSTSRYTNLAWTGCGKGAHGLKDVGNQLEVRSVQDSRRGLLVRPSDADDDPYVLVEVRSDNSCVLIGWEYCRVVKRLGRILGHGTDQPCWILDRSKLRPMVVIFPILRWPR